MEEDEMEMVVAGSSRHDEYWGQFVDLDSPGSDGIEVPSSPAFIKNGPANWALLHSTSPTVVGYVVAMSCRQSSPRSPGEFSHLSKCNLQEYDSETFQTSGGLPIYSHWENSEVSIQDEDMVFSLDGDFENLATAFDTQ
mmetsp:Transcript_15743/g.27783  ORF Transcript_15743/g.27783 Transcript_15743/m.27783 type:complete len:139 (+) Transcript_15743:32-448(+)